MDFKGPSISVCVRGKGEIQYRGGVARVYRGDVLKTLVVEDDSTTATVMAELLGFYGAVSVVKSGGAALDLFRRAFESGEAFDLVCLDIMLPDMSGQSVLKVLREHEASIGCKDNEVVRIVMTSSRTDPPAILGAFREQCDDYLVKPTTQAKLHQMIKKQGLVP
ncbi:MAG: response regulator [Myxococcota bacterium]|nr:response regulator [Myxococcota bacterium]